MDTQPAPRTATYAGLFLVVLATIMYEIVLTRIFSVTMWYHFAFVAISVAMFGMTVGAVVVYLWANLFARERLTQHLAVSALAFALSMVGSFLFQLLQPFGAEWSLFSVISTLTTYAIIAVPFVFSGVCVALCLTRFPRHVSRLYAVDLIGAAIGCVLVVAALNLTDGPTAVMAVAGLASLGAACFAGGAGKLRRVALAVVVLVAAFVVVNTALVRQGAGLVRLQWVKGQLEPRPLYERWNSFSRVTVYGDPARPSMPAGWGLSPVYRPERGIHQLSLLIDATAGTVLTAYGGSTEPLEHLKYDITNLPHYLRRNANVLVVGVGGGRDVLSALLFEQRSVLGLEINRNIIDTVNVRFGDFTGHLDRHPRVTFVNDEARSYVARQPDRFDIIQISLIDTYAATAAGAFVLTENALYTVEAWKLFLDRLTTNGVLAVSRYYFASRPDEIYRLTTLARASLLRAGVADPRQHIAIVKQPEQRLDRFTPVGVATVLVSRAPFSDQDLDALDAFTRRMHFEPVISPRASLNATFATLAGAGDLTEFLARFPVNIEAPTDDSPFFFHTLRLRDAFSPDVWKDEFNNVNLKAVSVLGGLLVTVLVLTAVCIIGPLSLTTERATLTGSVPLFVFFASIGLGFMLVEISQMQRLIIFLGHPTYSLSVVLFALLVSSGIGSYLSERVGARLGTLLALLLGTLALFGAASASVISGFQESTTPIRILAAVGMLFPPGLLMGTAFPLGMRIAAARAPTLTPWLWGVNGATSVCASVLAVVIALSWGIAMAFWTGVACYVVAGVALRWAVAAAHLPVGHDGRRYVDLPVEGPGWPSGPLVGRS
jgi:hypothetical protein